jgi:hypothetical protein
MYDPPKMKGLDLFEHRFRYQQQKYEKKEKEDKISKYLAYSFQTHHQKDIVRIDYNLKIQRELMDNIGGGATLDRAMQVRLDNLAMVKIHSCFINVPKGLKQLVQWLELLQSVGRRDEIKRLSAQEKSW